MPRVSVLMPVHGREPYISEAIESVLAQTLEDLELLVVADDLSEDTKAALHNFGDARIRVVRHDGTGLASALNAGLTAAEGEIVARLDADDRALPSRLEHQAQILQQDPATALVGTQAWVIDTDGDRIRRWRTPADPNEIRYDLLFLNPIVHSSAAFRLSDARKTGGYPEEDRYRFAEDYALWSRLAEQGEVENLATPLVEYRRHGSSITANRRAIQLRSHRTISQENVERWLGLDPDAYPGLVPLVDLLSASTATDDLEPNMRVQAARTYQELNQALAEERGHPRPPRRVRVRALKRIVGTLDVPNRRTLEILIAELLADPMVWLGVFTVAKDRLATAVSMKPGREPGVVTGGRR